MVLFRQKMNFIESFTAILSLQKLVESNMSLKKRLLIYFMIIFLLIMLITISIIFNRQRSLIENEMSERVRILSNTLSQISLEPLLVYEISSLEQNLESIKEEKYVKYARIVTKDNL